MQCPTFNLLIVMLNEHTGGLKSMHGLLTFLIKASEDHLYNDNGEDLFPNVCKEAVNTGGFSLALMKINLLLDSLLIWLKIKLKKGNIL